MGTLLLGEIESSLLQGYFGELRTKEVVVTEERMEHIRELNLKKLMEKNRLLYSRE